MSLLSFYLHPWEFFVLVGYISNFMRSIVQLPHFILVLLFFFFNGALLKNAEVTSAPCLNIIFLPLKDPSSR